MKKEEKNRTILSNERKIRKYAADQLDGTFVVYNDKKRFRYNESNIDIIA